MLIRSNKATLKITLYAIMKLYLGKTNALRFIEGILEEKNLRFTPYQNYFSK
jgi:hypothetical protein